MDKITIDRPVLERMLKHAREAFPLECCGLLTGKGTHTSGIREATNAVSSSSAFFVPPVELFDFFRYVRASRREFTGIYHSHPVAAAVPSEKDQREFHYPEVAYWIISLQNPEPDIRCYRWGKIGFEAIQFEVLG